MPFAVTGLPAKQTQIVCRGDGEMIAGLVEAIDSVDLHSDIRVTGSTTVKGKIIANDDIRWIKPFEGLRLDGWLSMIGWVPGDLHADVCFRSRSLAECRARYRQGDGFVDVEPWTSPAIISKSVDYRWTVDRLPAEVRDRCAAHIEELMRR